MDELERLREILAGMGLGGAGGEGLGLPPDMPPGTLGDALDQSGGWGAMEGYGKPKGQYEANSGGVGPRGMMPSTTNGPPNNGYNLNDIMDFIKKIKQGGSYG